MPGYLYIVTVMSAGLLSVLWLALRTEKDRSRAVDDALGKLPGIHPERRLTAGRRGLAVDDRQQALCVICAETQTVRLYVVPFADLGASELWVDGKPVSRVERGSPFESVTRQTPQAQAAAEIRLRLEVRDRRAPVHELVLPDLRLAKYWQSQLRAMIAATESVQDLQAVARRPVSAASAGAERRAAMQPGPARKPDGAASLARVAASAGQNGDNRFAAAQSGSGEVVSPQLRAALRRYLSSALRGTDKIVISERKLRDACAPALPLIRFHEQMNRLRRAKALGDYRLSYRRKSETWRISRSDERRAAA